MINIDDVFMRYKRLAEQAQTTIDPKNPVANLVKDANYQKWSKVNRYLEMSGLTAANFSVLNQRLNGFSTRQNAKFHKISRKSVENHLKISAAILEPFLIKVGC